VRTTISKIESRRACPELVERGRLNLAQDAVLGWHAPLKSPAGTTEKVIETWSWIRAADRKFSAAEYLGSAWDCLRVTFSRPYGTFRLSNLYPGLRPGLSSAVPTGLDFAMLVLVQGLHAQIFVEPLRPDTGLSVGFRLRLAAHEQQEASHTACGDGGAQGSYL
jgi:hypothetical protein